MCLCRCIGICIIGIVVIRIGPHHITGKAGNCDIIVVGFGPYGIFVGFRGSSRDDLYRNIIRVTIFPMNDISISRIFLAECVGIS